MQSSLANVQRELLNLFALDLPEEELNDVRRVLARHFAERATKAMDQFAEREGLTADDMKQWAYDHERSADRLNL